MLSTAVRCCVFIGLGALIPGVRAQPPEPLPPEIGAWEVLDDLRQSYRSGPFADEVLVTIRPPDGPSRSDRIVVRTDCTAVGPEEPPRRVLLELGPLRVFLGEGRMVATHSAERGVYFARDLDRPIAPDLVGELLPPVPAPQLAIVAADAQALRSPLPYARGLLWTTAVLAEGVEPTTYIATGRAGAVEVKLWADLQARRVSRLTATIMGPRGVTTIDLVCRAVDPGDPERWAPDLAGREPVESLGALRAPRNRPELRIGDPVPDLGFLAPDMTPWSLHAALRSAAAAGPPGDPPPAVVVLFRVPPAGEGADRAGGIESDARAGLAAIRALARPAGGAPQIRFVDRAAAIIELPDFDRDGFQRLRQRWGDGGGGGAESRVDADDLLWGSAGAQSIDRFARDDDAMIVVASADRALRAVIHLDGRAADAAAITDELRAALAPAQAAPPTPPASEDPPAPPPP